MNSVRAAVSARSVLSGTAGFSRMVASGRVVGLRFWFIAARNTDCRLPSSDVSKSLCGCLIPAGRTTSCSVSPDLSLRSVRSLSWTRIQPGPTAVHPCSNSSPPERPVAKQGRRLARLRISARVGRLKVFGGSSKGVQLAENTSHRSPDQSSYSAVTGAAPR